MYAPVIRSARPRKRYKHGRYRAVFFDQIVARGAIEYEFIIAVFEDGAKAPFLFVTSERNDSVAANEALRELGLAEEELPVERGESHFLCVFDMKGHYNMGDSDRWADAEQFESAALEILKERLGGPLTVV